MSALQRSLFDKPDADAAVRSRDDAIGQAAAGASDSWKASARDVVRRCAASLDDFTTDDVLAELERMQVPMPPTLSALGPVMLDAARAGEIVKTERRRQTRFKHRHRDLTVWTLAPWSGDQGMGRQFPRRPMR